MASEHRDAHQLSIWDDAVKMIEKARRDGVETVWDRFAQQQPGCKFCELGLTCRNCNMGPCRISYKENGKMQRGVCGADGDVIVARNFGRFVAGGAAGHSDHGRDLIELLEAIVDKKAPDYTIKNEEKLRNVSAELGIAVEGRATMEVARDLMEACFGDFGSRKKEIGFVCRVPEVRRNIWRQHHTMPRGIDPVVSEMVLAAARHPEMIAKAKAAGAEGINIGGLCCTGNELLGRQGIPMAGNHLMTELAIVTGAVEAVVVDYQCIMPSMVQVAACYHTKFITTADKARFTGAIHIPFNTATAAIQARQIIELAIAAYAERDQTRVEIPVAPVDVMVGYSNETLLKMLGGTLTPLLDAIKDGSIRGVVALVGCNNPKFQHDSQNVGLAKELIKRDILVLATGCITTAAGKAGLLVPKGMDMAGAGLQRVCSALNIPPVLHFGSCVDNSRVIHLCGMIANALGVDIADLPVWGASPEWYSEKAVAIGLYCVASGIPVQIGTPPQITGSKLVTDLALGGLEEIFGAAFLVEPDYVKAAEIMDARIKQKRLALGLSA